jgi:hypothetical protein
MIVHGLQILHVMESVMGSAGIYPILVISPS